jgi:dihydrolipoamide dehydrogenase
MSNKNTHTELLIIGAGPGGYTAAFHAADRGMNVTLVDPEIKPGGVCLYRGCIPSKAYLHVMNVVHEMRRSKSIGVDFGQEKIDFETVWKWKNKVVDTLTGYLSHTAKHKNVDYIRGFAHFLDSHTAGIDLVDEEGQKSGKTRELSFDSAIIATGSTPRSIPDVDPELDQVISSDAFFKLESLPDHLLIVGGGFIGVEMGQAVAAMGSEVTLLELTGNLLPGTDHDLVSSLKRRLKQSFSSILLNSRLVEAKKSKKKLEVTIEDKKGEHLKRSFDLIMTAVGRQARLDDIGLEKVDLEPDKNGFLNVDKSRQTTTRNIYAVGDITGEPMLAHKAMYEAKIAVEALAGENAVYDSRGIPAVVYSDPEIAYVGLTENRARKEDITHKTEKIPWRGNGRAQTMNDTVGVTKLIFDPSTKRILGAGIAGSGAGELITEVTLAMEMGAVTEDIRLTVHPHPTLSETIMGVAEIS